MKKLILLGLLIILLTLTVSAEPITCSQDKCEFCVAGKICETGQIPIYTLSHAKAEFDGDMLTGLVISEGERRTAYTQKIGNLEFQMGEKDKLTFNQDTTNYELLINSKEGEDLVIAGVEFPAVGGGTKIIFNLDNLESYELYTKSTNLLKRHQYDCNGIILGINSGKMDGIKCDWKDVEITTCDERGTNCPQGEFMAMFPVDSGRPTQGQTNLDNSVKVYFTKDSSFRMIKKGENSFGIKAKMIKTGREYRGVGESTLIQSGEGVGSYSGEGTALETFIIVGNQIQANSIPTEPLVLYIPQLGNKQWDKFLLTSNQGTTTYSLVIKTGSSLEGAGSGDIQSLPIVKVPTDSLAMIMVYQSTGSFDLKTMGEYGIALKGAKRGEKKIKLYGSGEDSNQIIPLDQNKKTTSENEENGESTTSETNNIPAVPQESLPKGGDSCELPEQETQEGEEELLVVPLKPIPPEEENPCGDGKTCNQPGDEEGKCVPDRKPSCNADSDCGNGATCKEGKCMCGEKELGLTEQCIEDEKTIPLTIWGLVKDKCFQGKNFMELGQKEQSQACKIYAYTLNYNLRNTKDLTLTQSAVEELIAGDSTRQANFCFGDNSYINNEDQKGIPTFVIYNLGRAQIPGSASSTQKDPSRTGPFIFGPTGFCELNNLENHPWSSRDQALEGTPKEKRYSIGKEYFEEINGKIGIQVWAGDQLTNIVKWYNEYFTPKVTVGQIAKLNDIPLKTYSKPGFKTTKWYELHPGKYVYFPLPITKERYVLDPIEIFGERSDAKESIDGLHKKLAEQGLESITPQNKDSFFGKTCREGFVFDVVTGKCKKGAIEEQPLPKESPTGNQPGPCQTDSDCGTGQACFGGTCSEAGTPQGEAPITKPECTTRDDCETGVCTDGKCVKCTKDADCGEDRVCEATGNCEIKQVVKEEPQEKVTAKIVAKFNIECNGPTPRSGLKTKIPLSVTGLYNGETIIETGGLDSIKNKYSRQWFSFEDKLKLMEMQSSVTTNCRNAFRQQFGADYPLSKVRKQIYVTIKAEANGQTQEWGPMFVSN